MSRYPQLTKDLLAPGVSYMCAYGRLILGWELTRAVSEVPKKRAQRRSSQQRIDEYVAKRTARHAKLLANSQARLYAWERADWNKKNAKELRLRAAAAEKTAAQPVAPWQRPGYKQMTRPLGSSMSPKKLKRKCYVSQVNDTSPDHIRKLRAAYCDEFIKTGNLNQGLLAQLKDYADDYQKSASRSQAVSAQPQTQGDGRWGASPRDDGRRDDVRHDDTSPV